MGAAFIGLALWALIPGFIARGKGRSFWGYYFLSFLITPLITMIITLCLSSITEEEDEQDLPKASAATRTKAPAAVPPVNKALPAELPQEESSSAAAAERPTGEVRLCRYCGCELSKESEFCSQCGKQVQE